MRKLLTIISPGESNKESLISTKSIQNYHSLEYINDSKKRENVKEGTRFRPIHISELQAKLSQRDFNIYPFKVIDNSGNVYLYPYTPEEMITEEDIHSKGVLITDTEKGWGDLWNILKDDIDFETVKDMEGDKNYNFYNASTKEIDILNGTTTIDVLKVGNDSYTNILSLIDLRNISLKENIEAKVNLGIQYSCTIDSEVIVVDHNTTFQAFEYNKNEEGNISLLSTNFIEDVASKVQIEYIDGIVRVFPISNSVSECIISNCIVTYGGLKQ